MINLESESASPLYHQMMQSIRADIEKGIYPTGSRIPTEHELETIYRVSRVTVRRALSELTAEGLLERKQGKGTFVSTPKIAQNLKNINSFHEACRKNGRTAGTRVIYVREIPAEPADRTELNLPEDSRVIETLRLRMADDEPVVLEKNHFSTAFAYLEEADLNGSLYQVLREYGIEPRQATHDISLGFATEKMAKLLEVEAGAPLLRLHEVVYDQKGRPLHSSQQWIRGDKFVFHI